MSADNKNQLFELYDPNQLKQAIIDGVVSHYWRVDNHHRSIFPPEPVLPLNEITNHLKDGVNGSQSEAALLTAHWNAELFPTNYPNKNDVPGVSPNVKKLFAKADAAAGINTKIDRTDLGRGQNQTKVVESNGSPVNISPLFATESADPNLLTVIAVPDESSESGWRILARRTNTDHGKDYRTGLVYQEIPVDETGSVTFGRIDQPSQDGSPGVVAIREDDPSQQVISNDDLRQISSSHFTFTPHPGSLEIVDHSTNGTRVEQVVVEPSDSQIATIGEAATHLANK